MADRLRDATVLFGVVLGAAALALVPSCLERRDEVRPAAGENRCTTCHGDATREGDALLRSAPPRDLLGASHTSYPGVGAHSIHLQSSATHAAFACSECHVVPDQVDSPGHADDGRPAELVFGELAQRGGHNPSYDPEARTCQDSYCHGQRADAVWSLPRSSDQACGSCHGLPPAAPHPRSERCYACHAEVIDEHRRFVAPELHVNGVVEHASSGCTSCHGQADDPAPPLDTGGNTAESALGVGAHQAHLEGGQAGRPLACSECHSVPVEDAPYEHVDGLPAEVTLTGVGAAHDRAPTWDAATASCVDSWCHAPGAHLGESSPSWVSGAPLACDSCHGLPPPPPHPRSDDCSSCHGEVVGSDDRTIAERLRHVDGVVDVTTDQSCMSCHGDRDPAPPRDLAGNTRSSAPGVGAHRTHLDGTPRSRAVACAECHRVPERLLDPGHVDSTSPAEVTLSGVALSFGPGAAYENGRCTNTSCHGALFPLGNESGGTNVAPRWTRVDGTEAACGSCHGLPPPAPHPRGELNPICSACHENIEPDNVTFSRPELHVDGVVTFELDP